MADISNSTQFTVGEWTVEPSLDRMRRANEETILEPRIMDLLLYLANHAGETISTNELAENVWSGRAISDQPVYQGIAQLRKALDDEARNPRFIATIPKKGYRLIATVQSQQPEFVSFASGPRPEKRARSLVPVLSLLIAGSYLFLSTSDVSLSRNLGNTAPREFSSIAVLPFVDMSEDQSQRYLGDGIAEELIHRIATVPDVRMVARTSSFALRDSGADIREIGERLGADVVLEGSIRRAGDRLRVTAQLIDASDGFHIWSQSYEPLLADSLVLQDQIALSVAELLRSGPGNTQLPRRSWTESSEAADAYYLGMFQMHKRRPDSLNKALAHFQTAVRIDPEFALAYAGLAKTYFLASDARYGDVPDAEAFEEQQAAMRSAQALDDRLPEVLELLIGEAFRDDNYIETEQLILKAVSNNPNYAPLYKVYWHLLVEMNRLDEALSAIRKATELDPLSPILRVNLAVTLAEMNRAADAEAEFFKAIELDPDWHLPYAAYGRNLPAGQHAKAIQLGQTAYAIEGPQARRAREAAMLVAYNYLSLEDFAKANEWYEKAKNANIDEWWLANERLHWLIAQDRYDEADALLTHWEQKQTNYINVYRYGGLYRAILGQDAAAIVLLEKAAAMSGEAGLSSLYENNNPRWGYMPAVHLARLYLRSGMSNQGAKLLDDAENQLAIIENTAPGMPGVLYIRASIHSLRGEYNDAIKSLRRAADAGWTRAWFVARDPVFVEYRNDPQFRSILDDMRAHLAAERQALAQTPNSPSTRQSEAILTE